MNLYKELVLKALENEQMQITFTNLTVDVEKIVQQQCYVTLQKIKAVIEDESLDDKECFMKIEQIICIFEQMASRCDYRHDIG